jgi:RNA polymerase sigma-54 factor
MVDIKQRLSQKMTQKLSPQQIQLMKLLQIPTYALEQRIQEEMEVNPALEEDTQAPEESLDDLHAEEEGKEEEFELDDYLEEYMEDDPTTYKQAASSGGGLTEEDRRKMAVAQDNFSDYLEEQLAMRRLKSDRKEKIARQIMGSLDEDGYLRRELYSILDDLMFAYNIEVSEEEVREILGIIQEFDPPGVAARSLKECLLIQVKKQLLDMEPDEDPDWMRAQVILQDYFDAFAKKHYSRLLKVLDCSEDELKAAIEVITSLNPRPASAFSTGRASLEDQYIIPDFIVENKDGDLVLSLNSMNAPELQVNHQYQRMLKTYSDQKSAEGKPKKKQKEAAMFIKQKIDSARWFIDAIQQRQQTMYKTMYAILQYQREYFMTGDQSRIKPMILKDISAVTGLDISTISRVASAKYVQTEFGTKLLKDFFSESMQNAEGEEVSTLEIKNTLNEIVKNENKQKPLSDQKLMNALKEKGYNVARRTVAKYRDQLSIPVARLRKEL